MATKAGRPYSDNPRTVQTRIRMTKEEAEMLNFCAETLGRTKTDIVITGIRKVYADIKK